MVLTSIKPKWWELHDATCLILQTESRSLCISIPPLQQQCQECGGVSLRLPAPLSRRWELYGVNPSRANPLSTLCVSCPLSEGNKRLSQLPESLLTQQGPDIISCCSVSSVISAPWAFFCNNVCYLCVISQHLENWGDRTTCFCDLWQSAVLNHHHHPDWTHETNASHTAALCVTLLAQYQH